MKKVFLLGLVLLFSTALLSCVNDSTTTTALDTTSTQTLTTAETVYELADMYEGSHEVSAMGSDVTYLYSISFDNGDYAFHSVFDMSDTTYTFDETGTYVVNGNVLTITPTDGTAVNGTIGDGTLTVSLQASAMGAREERTLTEVKLARIYVGTHTVAAMGSEVDYVYIIKMSHGTYSLHSMFTMADTDYTFDEVGTYSVEGVNLTMTPDGETAVTGTIGDGTITIAIKASSMASREDRTLTSSSVAVNYEGTHTVSAMGSDVIYTYTIQFVLGNYSFHSDFEMGGTAYTFDEIGTYTIEGNVITLTPDGETAVTGTINTDGTLELPIKASSMATRESQTFTECIIVID